MLRTISRTIAGLVLIAAMTGCGLQSIPQAKNKVEAALAETTNQYKRRADLIPNLVSVVKGYAAHEQETLTAVVEARAKATQTTIDPGTMDPKKLQEYMASQGNLSSALGRLMVVVEKYPDLKADASFRDLSAQLEGTENRITVARQRYIESINEFNNLITVPPTSFTNSIIYHHEKMPQWTVSDQEKTQIEAAPKVDFK
ncbi:MAG TPA: LemA family protein [Oligoflexus sp.]|uniref:LemA family protein n=1 Tax=Oligoflexus sp. TaxID=1971216 RepID=UPI002D255C2D|nr:LemA family protein [Oligoflexus sp.]HYX38645.1 LemA family protein [Oligoflexus sp.]